MPFSATYLRRSQTALWLASFVTLASLLLALAIAVRAHPSSSAELAVMEWLRGWDGPGVGAFLAGITFVGSAWLGFLLLTAGITYLLLSGRRRLAGACVFAGVAVGAAVIIGDYTLGEVVHRGRPVDEPTVASFPSVHTFSTIVFWGFMAFLAVAHHAPPAVRIPFVLTAGVLIASMGVSRVYREAHWPTDVAGGYLLGLIALLALIPLYLYVNARLEQRGKQTA